MSGHEIVQQSGSTGSNTSTGSSEEPVKSESNEQKEFSVTGSHIRFGDSEVRKSDLALILLGVNILIMIGE